MTSLGEVEAEGHLLYRGAEADVWLGSWQGEDAIFKVRKPLPYRLKALDDSVRRQRTMREADMLRVAKEAGTETPFVLALDVPSATLVIEHVKGDRLKDLVTTVPPQVARRAFVGVGRGIARLHRAGVMHGDLTTANVIMRNGSPVFIDFGLAIRSERLEDHAVDFRLIKETLMGAHVSIAGTALDAIFEGYGGEAGAARLRAVRRQLESIERRGRYARIS